MKPKLTLILAFFLVLLAGAVAPISARAHERHRVHVYLYYGGQPGYAYSPAPAYYYQPESSYYYYRPERHYYRVEAREHWRRYHRHRDWDRD